MQFSSYCFFRSLYGSRLPLFIHILLNKCPFPHSNSLISQAANPKHTTGTTGLYVQTSTAGVCKNFFLNRLSMNYTMQAIYLKGTHQWCDYDLNVWRRYHDRLSEHFSLQTCCDPTWAALPWWYQANAPERHFIIISCVGSILLPTRSGNQSSSCVLCLSHFLSLSIYIWCIT